MATTAQEKTYNKIIEYYNYADELIRIAENSKTGLSQEQFDIIEDLVEVIEKSADKLTQEYIEFVRGSESEEILSETRKSINDISSKIEECRQRILNLYIDKN